MEKNLKSMKKKDYGTISSMTKYIKPKMFKKNTVYTMITFTPDGMETLDVLVESVDNENQIIIVREICDVYKFTLTFTNASERLLQQVYR